MKDILFSIHSPLVAGRSGLQREEGNLFLKIQKREKLIEKIWLDTAEEGILGQGNESSVNH